MKIISIYDIIITALAYGYIIISIITTDFYYIIIVCQCRLQENSFFKTITLKTNRHSSGGTKIPTESD